MLKTGSLVPSQLKEVKTKEFSTNDRENMNFLKRKAQFKPNKC